MLHFVTFLNLFICTQIFYKYSSMILFACLGFCLLAALMGIINDIHHQKVCKSSLKLMHVTVLGEGGHPTLFYVHWGHVFGLCNIIIPENDAKKGKF